MKIAVNIFTYARDAYCLGQCLAALDKLPERSKMEIYVWDDAAHPCPYAPPGVHYEKTAFKRNGNLNGRDCVLGMLLCMQRSIDLSGADVVAKIDCDTYALRLDRLLLGADDSMKGIRITADEDYTSGIFYALPAAKVYDMLIDCSHYQHEDPQHHYPEDRTICALARRAGLEVRTHDCVLTPWKEWLCAPFKYTELQGSAIPYNALLRYLRYDVVNFGNRHELEEYEDPHRVAADCMRAFHIFNNSRNT